MAFAGPWPVNTEAITIAKHISETALSVIICTKDRPVDLANCLRSLTRQTAQAHEVLVVDSSTEYPKQIAELVESYARQGLPARLVHTEPGLPHQRNVGVLESRGTYVLFLDDDIELFPDAVQLLLGASLETGNKVGVVYGYGKRSGYMNNRLQELPKLVYYCFRLVENTVCRVFFLPRTGTGCFQPSGMPTFRRPEKGRQPSDFAAGGFALVSREIARAVTFDETLTGHGYMEDDDFSFRVSRNYQNVYEPAAMCHHHTSSAARISEFGLGRMIIRNHHYLFKKNFYKKEGKISAFYLSVLGHPFFSLLKGRFLRAIGEAWEAMCLGVEEMTLGIRRALAHCRHNHSELLNVEGPNMKWASGVCREEYGALRHIVAENRIKTVLDLGYGTGRLQDLYIELGLEASVLDIATIPNGPLDIPPQVDLTISSGLQFSTMTDARGSLEKIGSRTRIFFIREPSSGAYAGRKKPRLPVEETLVALGFSCTDCFDLGWGNSKAFRKDSK